MVTYFCVCQNIASYLAHKSLTSLTNYQRDLQVSRCLVLVASERHHRVILMPASLLPGAERCISFFCSPERCRLSPGPLLGGHPHDDLLFHGPPVVRGRHRHLHRPHRLAENGDADVGAGRAAQIPRRQASHRSTSLDFGFFSPLFWTFPRSECF